MPVESALFAAIMRGFEILRRIFAKCKQVPDGDDIFSARSISVLVMPSPLSPSSSASAMDLFFFVNRFFNYSGRP